MNIQMDPHHGHVSVHASAGTGKTYLLVSRLLRALLEGARPDAILAVTFTHKAAAEMQTRLLERLLTLVDADDLNLDVQLAAIGLPANAELRNRARGLYEDVLRSERPVQTTTFHAFCQQLLRRFPLEAEVPPGFQLLDRTGVLRDEAWDALAVEASRNSSGDVSTALDTLFKFQGLFNTRQLLNSFLQHRADWWAYTASADDAVVFALLRYTESVCGHYGDFDIGFDAGFEPGADASDLIAAYLDDTKHRQLLVEFIALLLKNPNAKNQAYAFGIEAALDERKSKSERWQLLCDSVVLKNGDYRKPITKKAMAAQDIEAVKQTAVAVYTNITNLNDRLKAKRNLTLTRAWLLAGQRFLHHFQRLKREQRLLDFTDLEWQAYQLLNHSDNALWVQYKLDARIDHLLIDEFQDTNPTQWQLVLPLLQELAAGSSERQRSVFLVGDTKQSIYRFRRAEPRLFNAASDWMQTHLQAQRHPLNKSWRSSPAIMEFVNRLFSAPAFHPRLSDFETHATHREKLAGYVRLMPLIENKPVSGDSPLADFRDPLRQPRSERITGSRLEEGSHIANIIRDLIAQPLIIGEGENARPVTYSDVFILLRQRTHVADFEDALRRARIPYVGADRGTLLDCLEIRDMVDLLQWLTTPYDDLALAGILRSPLYALSDEQLQTVAAAGSGKDTSTGNWFDRLAACHKRGMDKVFGRAYQQLSGWQQLAGHIPVHDLLDRIHSEGNVIARYAAATPDFLRSRVVANLNRFLELALDTDAGRYPSLMGFLESLREMREQPLEAPDEPPAVGHDERVQILTVHAAKGLEAGVVFLADTGSAPTERNAHTTFVDWPAGEPGPSLMLPVGSSDDRDSFVEKQLQQQREAELREEANLLYVAVTRAVQLLFISATRPQRSFEHSWYATLCPVFDFSADGPHAITELAIANAFPEPPGEHIPKPATKSEVDPALCRPLPPIFSDTEIAPSQTSISGVHLIDRAMSSVDEDARLRGRVTHRLLELLNTPEVDLNGIPARVAREFDLDADAAVVKSCWRETQAVINAPDLAPYFDSTLEAWNEMPIYYEAGGRVVHGVIDRILLRDNSALIIDYKSHQHARAENLSELAEHYVMQMQWYAQGARRLWPNRKVEAMLLFTACQQAYRVELTDLLLHS